MRYRFDGEIAGLGTASGVRIVIGNWPRSPFGPAADAMVEFPGGHRLLLAPTAALADFVAATYSFDDIQIKPVSVQRSAGRLQLQAGELRLALDVGPRPLLGMVLRAVPARLASAPAWATLIDPVAALVLPGVHTRGSAGGGRREYYGARDLHRLAGCGASWAGRDLGGITDVVPPVRFGFGSTPSRPAIVRITTTIDVPDG